MIFLLLQHESTMEAFGNQLKVTPEGRSYVMKVSFTSENPKKAARVVNAAADLYVTTLRDEKLGKTDRATAWLAERLQELRTEVGSADRAVEEYRSKNGINDVNGVTLNDQRLFDVNQRLSELRADYAGSQAKLQQISDMRSRGIAALEAVPEVLASRRSSICVSVRRSCSSKNRASEHLRRQASAHREYPGGESHASAQDRCRSRAHRNYHCE